MNYNENGMKTKPPVTPSPWTSTRDHQEEKYDWRRSVEWTKVINSIIFAVLILASLSICALSGMVRIVLGG